MNFLQENALKYTSVKWPLIGAFLLGVIPVLLQEGINTQLIPAEYHSLILTIVLPALAYFGKKKYQPELHPEPTILLVEDIDFFPGAGFAANGKTRHGSVFRSAFRDHGADQLPHGVGSLFGNGPAGHGWLGFHHRIAVGIHDFRNQIRFQQIAAVDHGGYGPYQLQGRNFKGLSKGTGG